MVDAPDRDAKAAYIEAYKTILRDILNQRPSGTRRRLATALGKNRSFVSHMSNPTYTVPIPAPHLEVIFEICHFPPAERRAFLDLFERAHPNRPRKPRETPGVRSLKIDIQDFGDEKLNRAFDDLVRDTTRRLARLLARGE